MIIMRHLSVQLRNKNEEIRIYEFKYKKVDISDFRKIKKQNRNNVMQIDKQENNGKEQKIKIKKKRRQKENLKRHLP